jgi:hypothetical protein
VFVEHGFIIESVSMEDMIAGAQPVAQIDRGRGGSANTSQEGYKNSYPRPLL